MQYLRLIYSDETILPMLPPAEAERWMAEFAAFTQDIRASGQLVGSNRLRSSRAGCTIKVRNGKISTTDGPFVEAREQLAGYYLIEAADLNQAIQTAARIPAARLGAVEVRPIATAPVAP